MTLSRYNFVTYRKEAEEQSWVYVQLVPAKLTYLVPTVASWMGIQSYVAMKSPTCLSTQSSHHNDSCDLNPFGIVFAERTGVASVLTSGQTDPQKLLHWIATNGMTSWCAREYLWAQGQATARPSKDADHRIQIKKHSCSPGWCGSGHWALACEPKGCQFHFQSGHVPGLQARSPAGGALEATTHWCFFPPFSLPSSLSLKINT